MSNRYNVLIIFIYLLAGCGGSAHLDVLLDPGKLQDKTQTWFAKNWGTPSAKAKRFFGGETWTYFQINDGKKIFSFFNYKLSECQISLDFDKKGKLKNSDYSGC